MSERESEQPFFMLKNVFTSMTFQLSNPLLFKFQLWYLNLALTHSLTHISVLMNRAKYQR